MPQVFISHAQEDAQVAGRVAAFLEGEGIRCWIAPRDVPPGTEYGAAILAGIEASDALILVLSEHSNESIFVRREVERAVSKAKAVLPLRIREVAPSGALEFFVASSQWVDAWQPPLEQHLRQLASAIRAVAGQPAPRPVLPPPRNEAARRRRVRLIAFAGMLALATLAVLWLWQPWLAPWEREPTRFLTGSWCQPMSGDAFSRTDFVALSDERVAGEVHYSHASQVDRFSARVEIVGGALALVWLEPAELAAADPIHLRVEGEAEMTIVWNGSTSVGDLPPFRRCAPTAGG